jgi:hypothetical protein
MNFCVQNTEHKYKIQYKNVLHNTARSQISEVQNPNESSSDELQWLEKQPTLSGPKQDLPGRLYRDLSKHNWTKLSLEGRASSMLPDGVKCTLHIKIKVKPNNFYSFTVHL